MKITRVGAIAAVAGASLWAESAPMQRATVVVCIESDPNIMRGTLQLASEIFAGIGVRIDWRGQGCPVGVGAIVVSLSYDRADNKRTNAFAYAQPYEGTHIVVFPNRFREFDLHQRLCVEAHVLVHEITHVLQGTSRHSATGIIRLDSTSATARKCATSISVLRSKISI